jgi:phenylalanyl-tRNA synthetase alpha chain
MADNVQTIRNQFSQELLDAQTSSDLEAIKVRYLGKKGPIQELMKSLKDVPAAERPLVGKAINDLKVDISDQLDHKFQNIILSEEGTRLSHEDIDVTLPGRRRFSGRKHIILQTLDRMIDILVGMGFTVQYGPDIDSDFYNFEALNFAPDHPARDMQDTFYIADKVLLRTHTSNTQVRVMENNAPPIRIIAPGKAYRNETITARSHVFFHQVEGVYIDKGVTFADLFATLDEFYKKFFEADVKTRIRPSYFPFVEPGMEVDVSCISCSGHGCGLCKHTGWLEVAGAGMVHPEVLKNGTIDPEIYSGYAWGMGVARLAMLKHGIKDIRQFYDNDLRFLEQFTAK